jgi:isoquinoline 1-oxidoreductase beta subunit
MSAIEITRRTFVAALGGAVGGLALGIRLVPASAEEPDPKPVPSLFVHIAADGLVSIVCSRSEMGQGIRSSLPVVVAEELGADWSRVRIVQGDGDVRYGDQNTDGSRSVRHLWLAMRVAGAGARSMLVAAAAARWGVPASRLVARDHAVHDPASGRALSFGDLATAAAALPVPTPESVALRSETERTRVGTALPLIDGPAYVTGQAVFGADVRLPGMLTAVIARPPVVGGVVARVDDAAALKVPGVRRVVRMPAMTLPASFQPLGGVAVVADHTWAALRGRAALVIEWNHGAHAVYDSATYRDALTASVRAAGTVSRNTGDTEGALTSAARVISAEYHVPHLSQSPMEPPAAVARVDGQRCEIWAPTQDPQGAQEEVAKALGLDKAQVTIHVTFLGGGFGRKSKPDFVVEAAVLAKEMGAPVRVQWTRDDDTRHGYYHACSTQRLEAGLDAAGKVVAWRHRIASPNIGWTFDGTSDRISEGSLAQGVFDLPLAIPNVRVERCPAEAHVRIGWLRSVYNINHAFAVQSFIAEIAAETGRDPKEVLLEVLGPSRILSLAEAGIAKNGNYGATLEEHPVDVGRLRRVIEDVTARAGWVAARKGGRALGLAAHRSFLTYVAVVAAASRAEDGGPRIDEVWITADPGPVVNLDRVRSQFEGAVIFGLSAALHGSITAKGGAIEQTNYRDYPIARIGDAPRNIHVEILNGHARPGGVGEPGVPPVAPAIANALFALTGRRTREVPLLGSAALPV